MPDYEFTVVADQLVVDDELSLEALRLLGEMVSRADGGALNLQSVRDVQKKLSLDDVVFDELLDELKAQGYVRRTQNRARTSAQRKWAVRPLRKRQTA
jgi:hypothetical protein